MAQLKPRSDSLIYQLNHRLDDWSKAHLPEWLYKELTLQPDRRFLKSDNPKAARNFALFMVGVALAALVISLLPS